MCMIFTKSVPTKTQLSSFLGTPGEDYFKGNPKSLNFYFLVIWWGKKFYKYVYFLKLERERGIHLDFNEKIPDQTATRWHPS